MRRFLLLLALALVAATPGGAVPDKTVLRAQEGAAALMRGKFEQAIALYDEAVKEQNIPPQRLASLYNDRGVAKWRLEQYEAALQDFNKSVEIYPQYAAVYNNRGNVLLDMDKPEEALKDFEKAIALAPAYGAAYNNRGNANEQMGRHEAAIEDYRKAIEIMPDNAVPYNGRGKAQAELGRPYSALRYLTRALTLNGKYPAAYRNRASVYLHLERYDDAVADFDRVISLSPDDDELYVGRGRAYARAKKIQLAYKDFSKAIELNAENADAYTERGAINNESRRYDQALEDLNQAISLDAELPEAHYNRAETYFRTGKTAEALADLEKAISLDKNYAEAYKLRGDVYESQGKIDEALADFRRAVEADPFSDEAKDAIARLTGTPEDISAKKIGQPVSGWEIVSPAPGRNVAINEHFPKIKIVLEMHGSGTPEILEWTLLKEQLSGIGLLRYYAGQSSGNKRNEYVVIVDTTKNEVVSIEPYISGEAKARWDWTEYAVTVTDFEGIASAYELRKPKPVATRRYEDNPWGGGFGDWGSSRSRYNGPPKNLFDWLFR